jgi:hydrogenase nickel incorporation protein HypA/HybF
MYEWALSESILDLVVECARGERIARVTRAVVEPKALRFCSPITAVDTVAAGADLVIQRIALRAICGACDAEYAPETLVSACPACGGFPRDILAGRETRVVSFDGV